MSTALDTTQPMDGGKYVWVAFADVKFFWLSNPFAVYCGSDPKQGDLHYVYRERPAYGES